MKPIVLYKHATAFIQRADWPKLCDIPFKARDAKTRQRKFPVGFPVRVCTLNLLFFNIFLPRCCCSYKKQMRD